MKQVYCIPFSKPFLHFLHLIGRHNLSFMCLLDLLACFPCDARSSMWGIFLNLKHDFDNPFHDHDLIGNDIVSRSKRVSDVSFLTWKKFASKCFWTFSNSFTLDLGMLSPPYFHTIEKHGCHQSVENIFLENPTFNFSMIACVLKCIICYLSVL